MVHAKNQAGAPNVQEANLEASYFRPGGLKQARFWFCPISVSLPVRVHAGAVSDTNLRSTRLP